MWFHRPHKILKTIHFRSIIFHFCHLEVLHLDLSFLIFPWQAVIIYSLEKPGLEPKRCKTFLGGKNGNGLILEGTGFSQSIAQ